MVTQMKKIIISALLMLSCSANAAFFSGNDLLNRMTSNDTGERMLAMGYVAGIFDALDGTAFCTGGRGITLGQLKDIVMKKLQNFPESRHLTADNFVYVALSEAFPCKKKKAS